MIKAQRKRAAIQPIRPLDHLSCFSNEAFFKKIWVSISGNLIAARQENQISWMVTIGYSRSISIVWCSALSKSPLTLQWVVFTVLSLSTGPWNFSLLKFLTLPGTPYHKRGKALNWLKKPASKNSKICGCCIIMAIVIIYVAGQWHYRH